MDNKTKILSKCSRAYDLFRNGKTPVELAIELNFDFQTVIKYWTEFLQLQNMNDLYNLYTDYEYHLDALFKIYSLILRNNMSIKDIENILTVAYDVTKLYQTRSNLMGEKERLKQHIMEYNLRLSTQLKPLPRYPSWNGYY